jgi:phenylacetate-CoA ligase
MPDHRGNAMREALIALLGDLDATQWLTPADHRAVQLERATRVVRHAAETVPYYASLRHLLPSGGHALSPEQWARLPILRRADIQRNAEALLSLAVPAADLPLAELVTSGSTGSPVRVLSTARTRLLWNALTLRDHLWHKRDLMGRLASIRFYRGDVAAYPGGLAIETWGSPADLVFRTGGASALNIRTGVDQQLEWLRRQGAAYLLTYPSNALELGRRLVESGEPLSGLRELRLFGEAADAQLIAACRERYAVPVVDAYSANEVGYIALQCEAGAYHEQAEGVLLEILDEQGGALGPGQVGRVVITTLRNFAMPLIRYEIGDYAEVGGPCACGRGLPALRRILGRTRNMLTLPNGERRWPALGVAAFRELAPVVQCQVVQHTPQRLEARLVVERALTASEEDAIRARMTKQAGHVFDIQLSYHDRIERSPTCKFEEFKSMLA